MLDGQEDPDLDPRGHDEAARVGRRLAAAGVSAVYVSPLRRTAQTAAPLLQHTGLRARVLDELREVRLGDWEGGGWRHEEADRVIAAERWDVIPGAESNESLHGRVRAALGALATAHPDQRVAVFTHGGVIGAALHLATGSRPFAFVGAANGSVNHLVVLGEHWVLRRYNDTSHLSTDLDDPPDGDRP